MLAKRSLICLALLSACESGDAMDGARSDDTRGNVRLRDEHNYSSQSSLSIPAIETASAADLDICWEDVVSDLQCHELEPQHDLDTLALLRFAHLSEDEVEQELTSGQLAQSEVDGYADYVLDHESTCAKLSSLTFFDTPIDLKEEYVESDDRTYLLLLTKGTTPGVGARTLVFLRPSANEPNTDVDVHTGCGMLEFSADLSSVEPLEVPADGPWVIDWRDITRDGQGNDVVFEAIDGIQLGFFAGKTIAELEEQILDLELIATASWTIALEGGRKADLAKARGRNGGGAFSGFDRDEEGVWLLGLMCSSCQNPAPIVLAILEPVAEDA